MPHRNRRVLSETASSSALGPGVGRRLREIAFINIPCGNQRLMIFPLPRCTRRINFLFSVFLFFTKERERERDYGFTVGMTLKHVQIVLGGVVYQYIFFCLIDRNVFIGICY